jgi:hypothetical protein
MRVSPISALLPCLSALLLMLLAGCATRAPVAAPEVMALRGQIAGRIPAGVDDRSGWAADIQAALHAQSIAPTLENICSVLAVIEQESGYQADPVVADLGSLSRRELDRRARAKRIPQLALSSALKLASLDGRSYAQRLETVRTEGQLSELYEEVIGRVPLGARLLGSRNPVQTGGAMQVSIAFADAHLGGYAYPLQGSSARREVFTRRGGVYFGIAHLLGYQTPYTRKIHRFADYNAGWYASRNAAFQQAVAVASGRTLALDGDLLKPGAPLDAPGQTESAVRSLADRLGMDAIAIRNELALGNQLQFNQSPVFVKVFALADARRGSPLPRETLPGITLDSPKITRNLTTAWFATRVYERYQACMAGPR